jgi:hypothetical protein
MRLPVLGIILSIVLGVCAGCGGHPPTSHATQISANQILGVLQRLLPQGAVVPGPQESEADNDPQPGSGAAQSDAAAMLTYDDGKGAGAIEASVQRLPVPVPEDATSCPDRAHFPLDHCVRQQQQDRTILVIDRGYNEPANPNSIKRWTAVSTTSDGRQIIITEWNASSPDAGTSSRVDPPLDTERLAKIVSAGAWQALLSALSAPPEPGKAPSTPELTKQQIQARLNKLLPANMIVANQSGAEKGYFNLTVDDGKGVSLVTITVQRWNLDNRDIRKLFTGAKILPDGTKVITREFPVPNGADGTVQWEADSFHKDGLRILVSELNTSAFGLNATRPNPPFSLEQLSAIALDASWTE